MSFVIAAPEALDSAATDLVVLGSTLGAATAAAAAQTTGIVAAAHDEVSAAIAALFSAHGRPIRRSAQAAAFHTRVHPCALPTSAAGNDLSPCAIGKSPGNTPAAPVRPTSTTYPGHSHARHRRIASCGC
ncbi:PE family protein [Mycobacterium tuberculosis CPHL_A]|nr:PE family protein [Mycobacterium tuberculosis CPHL_A]